MGKRRMTQLSEAIPTPALGSGSLWGLFGSVDRTQWRWEAPTARPAMKEGRERSLPAWLSEWDATSRGIGTADPRGELAQENILREFSSTFKEDVRRFRYTISHQSHPDIYIASFNRKLEHELTLGLVSEDLLSFALRRITDDLCERSANLDTARARCLSFYHTVWRGISASKVLRPVDFEGKFINELIELLSCLPSSNEVQILAQQIVISISSSQLQQMEHGIISLLKAWAGSWLDPLYICENQSAIQAAEQSVKYFEAELSSAQGLSKALQGHMKGENDILQARDALLGVKAAMYEALNAVIMAEQILSPFKASTKLLADFLRDLPRDMLQRILSSCSEYVTAVGTRGRAEQRLMRYCWLSTLAQIPNVNTKSFLQMWRDLEGQDAIRENEASDLILSHWVSQGYVPNAAVVRNSFEAATERADKQDFASLLFAINKHRVQYLTRMRELFLMLDTLGKYKWAYKILSRMNGLGLKVPASYLGRSINTMSNYDARLALKTFYLHKVILLGDKQIRVHWIPNFIIALINHRGIAPKQIWEVLRIPIYENIPRSQRNFQRSTLPQSMIELVHKMALAFAYSDARPPRVALRNVLQCLYHLRIHRAPVGPELSIAVTHIAISEEISKGNWIRQERLRYALHLIDRVEGKDVVQKADATVLNWRMYLAEKQGRENREENVLRLGPEGY